MNFACTLLWSCHESEESAAYAGKLCLVLADDNLWVYYYC